MARETKGTCCSCRGPNFQCPAPESGVLNHLHPAPGNPMPSSGSHGHLRIGAMLPHRHTSTNENRSLKDRVENSRKRKETAQAASAGQMDTKDT